MSFDPGRYSPASVSCILGAAIISGFGKDSMIEVTWDAEEFSDEVGADGEICRVANAAAVHGMVKVTLLQSSASNDTMTALLNTDVATGKGFVPFLLKAAPDRTLIASEKAWIKGKPSVKFSKGVEEREWTIRIINVAATIGGSV